VVGDYKLVYDKKMKMLKNLQINKIKLIIVVFAITTYSFGQEIKGKIDKLSETEIQNLIKEANNQGYSIEDLKKINNSPADTILKGSDISCLTALIKSNLIDKENRFGDIPCRNDLVLFYRLVTKCPAVPIPKSYATYRVGNNTVSSNQFRNIKYQFYVNRKVANKSMFTSILNVIKWGVYGIKKYYK
jgi:hypothetical protein